MCIYPRGLIALIFTILFQTTLSAKYLYKDEVVHRSAFQDQIEILGHELHAATGISLRLIMLKELPKGTSMVEYEKTVLTNFTEPTVLLIFAELNSEIDIAVSDKSLYKYFNRRQVLSPSASAIQAFVMAIANADSWEHFNEIRTDYGGSILPLIAGKAKPEQLIGKYAASMFNGYVDISHQIATSHNVVLKDDPGDTNQETLFYVKLFFYSFVFYAIVMYIRRYLYRRRYKNEYE